MVRAGIRIIENFGRLDDDRTNQSFSQEKAEGIIDRSLGHSEFTSIHRFKQPVGGQVLGAQEEDAGNGDALRGRGNTMLPQQSDGLCAIEARGSGVC